MRLLRIFAIATCTTAVVLLSQQVVPAQEPEKSVPVQASEKSAPAQASEESKPAQEPQEDLFPPEQLEALVAPIALYPDALLAQVFMASTYPLDVVQASRWLKENPALEGEALEEALMDEPWDPSVKTLVFFPGVLGRMNDNLDWTQDLGDAFLGQEADLMAAVQRLREDAYKAGNLVTDEHQTITSNESVITVEPAEPEIVYVPTYDPSTVYGANEQLKTSYYPSVYTQPTTSYVESSSATSDLVSFGAGLLVGGLLVAAIDWGRRDYYRRGIYYPPGYRGWGRNYRRDVNINRNVRVGDVNIDRSRKKWEHNPNRRGGVRYNNQSTRNRYANSRRTTQVDRDTARGFDRSGSRVDRKQRANTREVRQTDRGTAAARDRTKSRPESRKAASDRPAARKDGAGARRATEDRPKQLDRQARSKPDGSRPQRSVGEGKRVTGTRTNTPSSAAKKRTSSSRKTVSQATRGKRASAFQSQSRGGKSARSASHRGASSRASQRGGGRRSGGGKRRAGGRRG